MFRIIFRLFRRRRKPAPLPMPGLPSSMQTFQVRIVKYDENSPEWVKQLLSDPTHPGPEPTHAELQESLFAEIERLGINIPE